MKIQAIFCMCYYSWKFFLCTNISKANDETCKEKWKKANDPKPEQCCFHHKRAVHFACVSSDIARLFVLTDIFRLCSYFFRVEAPRVLVTGVEHRRTAQTSSSKQQHKTNRDSLIHLTVQWTVQWFTDFFIMKQLFVRLYYEFVDWRKWRRIFRRNSSVWSSVVEKW